MMSLPSIEIDVTKVATPINGLALRIEISSGIKNPFYYITHLTDANGHVVADGDEMSESVSRTLVDFPMDYAPIRNKAWIWVDVMYRKDIEMALQAYDLYGKSYFRQKYRAELERAIASVSQLSDEPKLEVSVNPPDPDRFVLESRRSNLSDMPRLWREGHWHEILRGLGSFKSAGEIPIVEKADFFFYAKARAYEELEQYQLALAFMRRTLEVSPNETAYRASVLSLMTLNNDWDTARSEAISILDNSQSDPGLVITAAETVLKSYYSGSSRTTNAELYKGVLQETVQSLDDAISRADASVPAEIVAYGTKYLDECKRLLNSMSNTGIAQQGLQIGSLPQESNTAVSPLPRRTVSESQATGLPHVQTVGSALAFVTDKRAKGVPESLELRDRVA